MSDIYGSYFDNSAGAGLATPATPSPSDTSTFTGTSSNPFSGVSGTTALGVGALGLGAAGLGSILARGESPLPPEFGQIEASVPGLEANAGTLFNEGQVLTGQGTSALEMAQNGQLTPEQQAQLSQYSTGLTNQTRQQFYSMGRNPDQDTAFISQTADNDAKVNAMAQQQIQSTIALGLGELSSGSSFAGQSLGFDNAANSALAIAGQAQITQDQNYSKSLTGAFSAIATLFGTVGGAAIGGPAGAAIGGAAGKAAGSLAS